MCLHLKIKQNAFINGDIIWTKNYRCAYTTTAKLDACLTSVTYSSGCCFQLLVMTATWLPSRLHCLPVSVRRRWRSGLTFCSDSCHRNPAEFQATHNSCNHKTIEVHDIHITDTLIYRHLANYIFYYYALENEILHLQIVDKRIIPKCHK